MKMGPTQPKSRLVIKRIETTAKTMKKKMNPTGVLELSLRATLPGIISSIIWRLICFEEGWSKGGDQNWKKKERRMGKGNWSQRKKEKKEGTGWEIFSPVWWWKWKQVGRRKMYLWSQWPRFPKIGSLLLHWEVEIPQSRLIQQNKKRKNKREKV